MDITPPAAVLLTSRAAPCLTLVANVLTCPDSLVVAGLMRTTLGRLENENNIDEEENGNVHELFHLKIIIDFLDDIFGCESSPISRNVRSCVRACVR